MSQKWNLQDIRPSNSTNKTRKTAPNNSSNNQENKPLKERDLPRRSPVDEIPEEEMVPARPRKSVPRVIDTDSDFDDEDDFEEAEKMPVVAKKEKRPTLQTKNYNNTNRSHKGKLVWALGFFVLLVGGSMFASAMLGGAEVVVYPKNREVTINTEVTAYAETQAGQLSYEILSLEATAERQVTATGQEEVTSQALGQIEISKTTAGSERLVRNTRFMTDSGLVFRIDESVSVPGATDEGPGTIRVDVFADEAGEEYNIAAGVAMNVPGFQESGLTELYNAISARSVSAFSGGFDGPQYIINDDELADAREALQSELRRALLDKIDREKPAGFVVYNDAVAITFNQLPASEASGNTVTLREEGVLQIPMFREEDFAEYIAATTLSDYDRLPVRLEDVNKITFAYTDEETKSSDLNTLEELNFTLNGQNRVIWQFNAEDLQVDIVGKDKTAVNQAIDKYPGIRSADAIIRPFWKSTFPRERANIRITEVISNN